MTSKARPGTMEVARAVFDLLGGGGGFDGGEEIGIADGFDDGSVEASVLRNEAIHGLIGPLHEAVGADGDDGVLHAVEQSFELALAGADGGETAFDLSGGFVDGGGDASDFVEGSVVDAGAKVALRRCGRRHRRCVRGGGKSRRKQWRRSARAMKKAMADPQSRRRRTCGLNGFDIGERIGEAHRASGDGNSHVEKWNTERRRCGARSRRFCRRGRRRIPGGWRDSPCWRDRIRSRRELFRRHR